MLLPPDGARVVGFKEIRYNPEFLSEEQFDEVIDFIMTAFDEPRIVFNLRSWKELANSGWWAEWPRRKVRREIETCDARFRRAHARYPDRTFMIDHAQYDGKPEGLRHLLDWLGETVDDTVMQEVSERRLGHLDKLREVGEAKKFWKRLVNSVRG